MTEVIETLQRALADRYRLERAVGAGGMATVYVAQDLRHNRRVAIKVLRVELAAAVGVDRFLKEIEVTAGLTHPHILGLIESGMAATLPFYVMPFVEGESLRQRLNRERQLPVAEAMRITRAIGSALDHAHRHGVVHRDIKPENVLLQDGHAVVADFGIALAVEQAAGNRLTESGIRLGTPFYMSPEQYTAEYPVDARADVYALGCVAYEMLAGTPPFRGTTAQAVLTSVMTTDPVPLEELRRAVPDFMAAAIMTALEKTPADRFDTAAEFVEALEHATARTSRHLAIRHPRPTRSRWRTALIVVAALIVGNVAGLLMFGGKVAPAITRHLSLMLPDAQPLALTGPGPLGIWQSAIAIAPAGDRVAYVTPQNGTTMVAVRSLQGDSVRVLAGTEGAYYPFFSPDGLWLGFFAGSQLKKISVAGGTPVVLTTVDRPVGADWYLPNRLLLSGQDGFQRRFIEASGAGDSSLLLVTQFGTPTVLPGGKWALGRLGSGQLGLLELATGEQLAITRRGVLSPDSMSVSDLLFATSPKYLHASRHIVYATEDGALMALPFDGVSRRVLGDPVPVGSGVRIEEGIGFAEFAISEDGTLLYVPGRSQLWSRLAMVGANGRLDTLPFPRAQYTQLRMSPTGRHLAVQEQKPVGGWDVTVLDLRTGVRQRVPVATNQRVFPAAWMPSGEQLLIGAWHPIRFLIQNIMLYDLRSGALEDLGLIQGTYLSVAPNGHTLVASDWRTGELFERNVRGDTTRHPLPGRGFGAAYSPDGRWLAWGGVDGSITVSAVPPTGTATPLVERGQQPMWSPNGRALIYRDGRRFLEVDVAMGVPVGRPRVLAEGPFVRTFAWNHTMTPDGRVVAMVSLPGARTRELSVVTGFQHELQRLAPTRR